LTGGGSRGLTPKGGKIIEPARSEVPAVTITRPDMRGGVTQSRRIIEA
jgi:hypothetical protein